MEGADDLGEGSEAHLRLVPQVQLSLFRHRVRISRAPESRAGQSEQLLVLQSIRKRERESSVDSKCRRRVANGTRL